MKLKSFLFIGIVSLTLYSCNNSEGSQPSAAKKEAKGGVVYGGTFDFSANDKIGLLYPPSIVDVHTNYIASHVYEGLVKFNPKDLSIEPGLAESWTISDDKLTYTFKLRKGVKFHNDDCFPDGTREVNAKDVKFTFEQLCKKDAYNKLFSTLMKDVVVGANEMYNGNAGELKGLKIVDNYTVEITLTKPLSYFLYLLANAGCYIFPEEAYNKYKEKTFIGTGPFMVPKNITSNIQNLETVILVRNDNYYLKDKHGNQLPYLDTIALHVIDSKKQELKKFMNKELEIVDGLPSESIKDVVEQQIADFQNQPPKFVLERVPKMATQYYDLNIHKDVLSNIKVRKALNYAINKTKIIDEVLKGEAYGPAVHGIVPPAFKGYDVSKIKGYDYDPETAKKLLAEAGFPNGKNFPTLKIELNSGGYKNTKVAFEIQKQLMENLNINVDLEIVDFSQKMEDEQMLKGDIFRSAWIADFPSPESFLMMFYGKLVPEDISAPSFPNTTRYQNPKFDELFEKAQITENQEERFSLLEEAEQLVINDAPIIPLWYMEDYVMIHSYVRNFYTNPMGSYNLTRVYFKERTKAIDKKD
ncbi:MAG: ABC transporter substrate-binding protein [Bacteroidetes bacterium]|nr:MAG: ABC transporter substrate-binding protein [Bacteroidota bacterium]